MRRVGGLGWRTLRRQIGCLGRIHERREETLTAKNEALGLLLCGVGLLGRLLLCPVCFACLYLCLCRRRRSLEKMLSSFFCSGCASFRGGFRTAELWGPDGRWGRRLPVAGGMGVSGVEDCLPPMAEDLLDDEVLRDSPHLAAG